MKIQIEEFCKLNPKDLTFAEDIDLDLFLEKLEEFTREVSMLLHLQKNTRREIDRITRCFDKIVARVESPDNFQSLDLEDPKVKEKCWVIFPGDRNRRHIVRLGTEVMQAVEVTKLHLQHESKQYGEVCALRKECFRSCVNPYHASFISSSDFYHSLLRPDLR